MKNMFQSITRIYKLNIPNIFYWSPKITAPRILSCHFRWLAIMVPVKPLKNGLFQIAFFFEKIYAVIQEIACFSYPVDIHNYNPGIKIL